MCIGSSHFLSFGKRTAIGADTSLAARDAREKRRNPGESLSASRGAAAVASRFCARVSARDRESERESLRVGGRFLSDSATIGPPPPPPPPLLHVGDDSRDSGT